MKFSLYGLPCAGKTTVMSSLSIPVIHGSTELNKMASGRFSDLPEEEKNIIRIRYAEQLSGKEDSFISDGHYSFLHDVVFTEADAKLYDVFIYLYCEPEIVQERLLSSPKNARFSELSCERIRKWQDFEIESLRSECHKRDKDFYVVRDISADDLQAFINMIEGGFSSYALAKSIVEQITDIYPEPCELHICDGDKTITEQDSFSVCTNGYTTHAFDGNFYTGYQSLKFSLEVSDLHYDFNMLSRVHLNDMIFNRISNKNYVILSSGVAQLWERISELLDLKNVVANVLISADTKYFIVKLLQDQGYKVIAYGDGKNDLYMLKKADKGFLYIGSYLSHSLRNADISDISLLYDKAPFILTDERSDIAEDISICKSTSGVNGARLADAHIRLGKRLGEAIRKLVPNTNAAVVVLERGGRFFGDGLYTSFGGTFYSCNIKQYETPKITQSVAIIVDSVINTGKSVLGIIDIIKKFNPDTEIYIASNVIQDKALKFLYGYKIFAVRTSSNFFIGSRQSTQNNDKGPDTADRLFNYID